MKLYLAVAALLLVLVAHTEAEDEHITVAQLPDIQTSLKEFGDDLTEKTLDALKTLGESEFAIKTRSWFTEHFAKFKQKIDETFTKSK